MYIINENIKLLCTHDIRDDFYYITNDGKIINKDLQEMKPFISNSGYLRVSLYLNEYKNNRRVAKKFSVHRLVAEYFCENDDPITKDQVNHINGDKLKNDYFNLEWVSQSENIVKAYDSNLCKTKGENCHLHNNRYTDDIVHAICKCFEKNMTYFEIIKTLNLCDYHKRSSPIYQRWRKYLKNLRGRRCRRDITSQYSY